MTDSPPIPPGNQPPYPLVEPPHPHQAPTPSSEGSANEGDAIESGSAIPSRFAGTLVAVAAAAAAAIGIALVRSRRAVTASTATATRTGRKAARAPLKPRSGAKPRSTTKAVEPEPATTRKSGAKRKSRRGSKLASEPKTESANAARPKTRRASAPVRRKPHKSSDGGIANRAPQDASRVSMGEEYEVRYWTKKFNVDRDDLQRAVDTVGNGAADVEQYLGKREPANALA